MTTPQAGSGPVRIAVAHGDGIGPEIAHATLQILEAAGAALDVAEVRIGKAVYEEGVPGGVDPAAWEVLHDRGVLLKGPITTPRGGGYKSVNVMLRGSLGLFANVRPAVAYHPFIATRHPAMDVLVVRENEEDLYTGIEHRQSSEVVQTLKLVSRPGSERLIRYAFEIARAQGRTHVTAMIKDNIMKMTDGLFARVFDEVAPEYEEIEADQMIIDIGAARLAHTPEAFDVVVTPNLYGDILSDMTAQLTGSVGLAPSANVGEHAAMFEAIHGSAPDIAGRGIANPSGMLLAGVMMLQHLGLSEVAERVHNAWLTTIEDGVHTGDVYQSDLSTDRVNTVGFTEAVIDRLGREPRRLAPARYAGRPTPVMPHATPRPAANKSLQGVDAFVDWRASDRDPEVLADLLRSHAGPFTLRAVTNRGLKVWPDAPPHAFVTDHWRARFVTPDGSSVPAGEVTALLTRLVDAGLDVIKTENLYAFDGAPGYSEIPGM
ncbi:MAG: NADP-dependent isocitrate dehydrogenase [Trueperaceae bacterium]|nr:NADP-dependent isocitrate dehydrogenase [Trueperaceae bacterium]